MEHLRPSPTAGVQHLVLYPTDFVCGRLGSRPGWIESHISAEALSVGLIGELAALPRSSICRTCSTLLHPGVSGLENGWDQSLLDSGREILATWSGHIDGLRGWSDIDDT